MDFGITNLASFNRSLNAAAERLPQHAVMIKRKAALDIIQGVVDMAPVDTGRFRGNWQMTTDQPELEELPMDVARGRDPGSIMAQAASTAAAAGPGISIWITNNVPYAMRLEEGSSQQAPRGTLGVTLGRVARGLRAI